MNKIKIFDESYTGFTKEFLELVKRQKARLKACNSVYRRYRQVNHRDFNFALKLRLKLEHARRNTIKHIFKKGQKWITKYMTSPDIDKHTCLDRLEVLEKCFNYSYKRFKICVTRENVIY